MQPPLTEEQKLTIDNTYSAIVSNILDDDGQCVLILGPELTVNKSGQSYKSYFKEIAARRTTGIDKYFEAENLFSFNNDAGLVTTRRMVKEFYQSAGDPVLLDMIARIKFPLIINVCPDTALNRVYKDTGIDFDKGFFSKDSFARFKDLPYPSKNKPVIYNIFGSVESDTSLILTHSKLYETIENLLPQQSLPPNIETFLTMANSFILLGVRFDSWYYQLICHKLKLKEFNKIKSNLGISYREQNNTVSVVLRDNFGLVTAGENAVQAVEKIITTCAENTNALRPKNPKGIYSLFVSYAWRQPEQKETEITRETPVDYLQMHSLLSDKDVLPALQIFRDHNDLGYGDSIESFMTRIGKGKTVVRVISDKYLRSTYCMIEAMLMAKYNDGEKRVYSIVWEDADLNNETIYRNYWRDKCSSVLENINDKLENDAYDNYIKIYRFIIPFINSLKDEVRLDVKSQDFEMDSASGAITINPGSKPKVEGFIHTIINKMKEQ